MTGKTRAGPDERMKALMKILADYGIHSPEDLEAKLKENEKLRRALGPEVIAAVSEVAIVMEKQVKSRKRKH